MSREGLRPFRVGSVSQVCRPRPWGQAGPAEGQLGKPAMRASPRGLITGGV